MLNSATGLRGWVLRVVGLFFCFLVLGIIVLSIVDLRLYPEASLRLAWWQKLGLPVNEKIASRLLPKAKSKEDLAKFQPQTLYWLYKDKVGLSSEEGYACGVEGEILSADSVEWKIMTGKGQEVKLDLAGQPVKYRLRNPYYDEEKDEWVEGNRIADRSYFDVGDEVRVIWNCPIKDPQQMMSDKGMIKQEYLKIVPVSISREITNEGR